jgi:hypothetical protein
VAPCMDEEPVSPLQAGGVNFGNCQVCLAGVWGWRQANCMHWKMARAVSFVSYFGQARKLNLLMMDW